MAINEPNIKWEPTVIEHYNMSPIEGAATESPEQSSVRVRKILGSEAKYQFLLRYPENNATTAKKDFMEALIKISNDNANPFTQTIIVAEEEQDLAKTGKKHRQKSRHKASELKRDPSLLPSPLKRQNTKLAPLSPSTAQDSPKPPLSPQAPPPPSNKFSLK